MRKLWVAFLGAALLISTWGGIGRAALSSSHATQSRLDIPSWAAHCNAKGTISYVFWGDKGELAQQLRGVALAEKACPGLHVKPFQDPNYDTDLKTKIGSGNAPDVFQVDAAKGNLKEFVAAGAVANLDSYIKRDHVDLKKIYWAKCLPDTYVHGHVYGMMRDCGNQGILFYNKDMFTAKHVKYPTNSWTYKDFANAAVKLTGSYSLPSDSTSTLRFGASWSNDDFAMNRMFWQFGGDWLSKDLKKCTLNTPAVQKAFQWWIDLRYKLHAAPTAEQASSAGDSTGGFVSQHYAMTFAGPWALDYVFGKGKYSTTKPPTFSWGAVRTPLGPKNRQAVMGAAVEAVYSGSHNKNAAWWLTRFVTQNNPLEATYGIGIPGDKRVINDPSIKKEYGATLPAFQAAQRDGRAILAPTQYNKWVDTINHALESMWKNQTSVQDATNKACSDAQSAGVLGG